MATVIGQCSLQPLRSTKKESVCLTGRAINSTADGVIDTALSVYGDVGMSLTRASAGTYNLVFPACPSDAVLQLTLGHTGTPNVFSVRYSTFAPTSGTATVITANAAGAATDNNSAGLQIGITLVAAMGK